LLFLTLSSPKGGEGRGEGGLQTKISVFALPHPGLLPNGEGEIAGRFNEKITVPGKLPDRPFPELKDISCKIIFARTKQS
jgi:hypothetical protein